MSRLQTAWVPVVAFTLGLIAGIALDRLIGGTTGFGVGLLVLLVPATLAFAGPLAQQYWSDRSRLESNNRELFRSHAELLLSRVFWALSGARLSYDVLNFRFQTVGQYNVSTDDGSRIEDLLQWTNARQHLLAEPTVGPLLLDVEARLAAGRAQKKGVGPRDRECHHHGIRAGTWVQSGARR